MPKAPIKIWVKVPEHRDPELKGQAMVRKPWQNNRFFTEAPEEVDKTSAIIRLMITGCLVEAEPPKAKKERVE